MTIEDKKLKISSDRRSVLFIDEKPLINYLDFYGKGAGSLDYEIAICIWVKRMFENAGKRKYCVAFELEEPLERIMPNFDSGNPRHIKHVLDYRKSNTPADFYIVKGFAGRHEDKGLGFQLKRFGIGIKSSFAGRLVDYLNKVLLRYRPGEVGLIVIIDADPNLDPSELSTLQKSGIPIELFDKVKVPVKSFRKVFLMGETASRDEVYLQEIDTGSLLITLKK